MPQHSSNIQQGLISIIIPAYNSGKYIETTLNNLFSQTYQNFEIIIAYDEKSTDDSLSLLQKINDTHPITIDIGKDTSSGSARNRGFKLAQGEYVIFVDADDCIHPEYLETMINIFDKHPELDVVCCDRVVVYESTIEEGWKKAARSSKKYEIYNREKALYSLLWNDISEAPWIYLVKKNYLSLHDISFPDYSHGDDAVYAHKLLINTPAIAKSHRILYLFVQHPTSITNSVDLNKIWGNYIRARTDVVNVVKDINPIYAEDYWSKIVRNHVYISVLAYDYSTFRDAMVKEEISSLPILHKYDRLPYLISALCYSLSKRLFYQAARILAKYTNVAGKLKSCIN